MSKVQQLRRGNTATMDARIGAAGEIMQNTDNGELRSHDGVTPGGRRILTEPQMAAYSSLAFTGVVNQGVPGALLVVDTMRKMIQFTLAGTYVWPALAGFDLGSEAWIMPQVAGVNIDMPAGGYWRDKGVEYTTMAFTLNQLVHVAKLSTTRFIVLNRY